MRLRPVSGDGETVSMLKHDGQSGGGLVSMLYWSSHLVGVLIDKRLTEMHDGWVMGLSPGNVVVSGRMRK